MKKRLFAWLLSLLLALQFSAQALAFHIGPTVEKVSTAPDTVHGVYLGQSLKDCQKAISSEGWEEVTDKTTGRGEPIMACWTERGPKVRESMEVLFDRDTHTVQSVTVSFTSDENSYTRAIADTMYQNLAALDMAPTDMAYTGESPCAEWKLVSGMEERRVRVGYTNPAGTEGEGQAYIERYIRILPAAGKRTRQ